MALVHYPVIDKNGATIAAAVTNLDLHDIARACRTYGVSGYYIVTPLADQRVLVKQILDHWISGAGGIYNPWRRQALEQVRIVTTFDGMIAEIIAGEGERPQIVATTARRREGSLSFCQLREMLGRPTPLVLAFGTAWGLTEEFMAAADHILDPLVGDGEYNHLSVRSAAAIILDRLLGNEKHFNT